MAISANHLADRCRRRSGEHRESMSALILVVDDEPLILDVVAELLEGEGYRVCRANDGQAALERAAVTPPDLLLSDVQMPRLDGIGLVRRLRERGHAIPVVVMSAVYAPIDIPGVRFVPKPFDLDELLAVVQQALDWGTSPP